MHFGFNEFLYATYQYAAQNTNPEKNKMLPMLILRPVIISPQFFELPKKLKPKETMKPVVNGIVTTFISLKAQLFMASSQTDFLSNKS